MALTHSIKAFVCIEVLRQWEQLYRLDNCGYAILLQDWFYKDLYSLVLRPSRVFWDWSHTLKLRYCMFKKKKKSSSVNEISKSDNYMKEIVENMWHAGLWHLWKFWGHSSSSLFLLNCSDFQLLPRKIFWILYLWVHRFPNTSFFSFSNLLFSYNFSQKNYHLSEKFVKNSSEFLKLKQESETGNGLKTTAQMLWERWTRQSLRLL